MLRVLGVLVMVILPAGAFVYVFLFKMMSFMQSRLGPMEAGPLRLDPAPRRGGQVPPEGGHRPRAGRPASVLPGARTSCCRRRSCCSSVMPFGPDVYFTNLDTAIFLAMGLSSVSVIGILIAGWASANKYSLIGGLRAAGQLIAYELPDGARHRRRGDPGRHAQPAGHRHRAVRGRRVRHRLRSGTRSSSRSSSGSWSS